LFADRVLRIEVSARADLTVICERQDLSEMLGNLMENACMWARGEVKVLAVTIGVEDDGPGLSDEQLNEARARGARLDEGMPGAGLGLAIVADLAALYGGSLDLQRSRLGGVAARLTLPTGQPAKRRPASTPPRTST
jgi:signal transduction histidine kinase